MAERSKGDQTKHTALEKLVKDALPPQIGLCVIFFAIRDYDPNDVDRLSPGTPNRALRRSRMVINFTL